MMHDDVDEVVQLLSRLPAASPDAARAEQVRTRCHAGLARRLPRQERSDRPGPVRRILEPALVSGFCLIYLSAVMVDVLRARGLL